MLMNLFVAKESMMIFAHEAYDNGFSGAVDSLQRSMSRVASGQNEMSQSSIVATNDQVPCRLSYYKLSEKVKWWVIIATFGQVYVLSLVPPTYLLNIYSVVVTVACPLIATVLPGLFAYTYVKQNYDQEQTTKCQQWYGFIYACFGLFIMPLFLMLTIYLV